MTTATELFEDAMEWLREHYSEYRFRKERDIEWTLQLQMSKEIEQQKLDYRIFDNYTVSANPRKSADLVILEHDDSVALAVEFKYEPSHERKANVGGDIWPSKLEPSAVFWTGDGSVEKDVMRVREFVGNGWAKSAFGVFIDEGSYFSWREPFEGAKWLDWGGGVSVLWSSLEP